MGADSRGGRWPNQFSLVTGSPLSDVSMIDVGLYAQDEWRIRPKSHSASVCDMKRRLAYRTKATGRRASRLLGTGACQGAKDSRARGIWNFLRPLLLRYILQAERFNGVTQQQYIVTNPNFFTTIPTPEQLAQLSTTSPTIYQVQSNLHVPYAMEAAVSLERQVTKNATVSVTYLELEGAHQLILRNANAPYPGTYNPRTHQRRATAGKQYEHLPVQLRRRV